MRTSQNSLDLYRKPILAALVAHLILLFGFLPHCGGGGGGGDGSGSQGATVKLKIIDKSAGSGGQCARTFGGIGIEYGYRDGGAIITKVFHGYPAEKAGLKAGDIILNNPDGVRGDPGSTITMGIQRDGVVSTVTIKRDKICITGDSD